MVRGIEHPSSIVCRKTLVEARSGRIIQDFRTHVRHYGTEEQRCFRLVPPPPSFPGGIDCCVAINRSRAKDPLLLLFTTTTVVPLPSMADSHRHLPLLVADAAVLVAIVFQPRLSFVAYAALMSLRLLLCFLRDGHACISQGCECVAASSSSEVWSFCLAGN
ncbi:unnamed protein product [Lactuca saligna]|uniref:Uncharacterized protein n=1 Tax=Lactuca saligna TaxID=75948 RepID=A0AA35Z2R2_LACSI|nr:unnamed protein product [Lactuca saligna]